MRILVTGGRAFHDKATAYGALDKAHRKRGITLIIRHNTGGVDFIATEWAQDNSVDVYICNKRPKGGEPEAAIVFAGGNVPGGMPVWEVKPTAFRDKS